MAGKFVPFQKKDDGESKRKGNPFAAKKSGGKLSPEDIAKLEARARKMPKGEAKDKLLQKIAMAKRMMKKG